MHIRCQICGAPIEARRKTRRYCGPSCRVVAFATKRAGIKVNDPQSDNANAQSDSVNAKTPNESANAESVSASCEGSSESANPNPVDLGPLLTQVFALLEFELGGELAQELRGVWEKELSAARKAKEAPRPAETSDPPPMTTERALKLLNLKGRFTADDIAKARRALARKFHPDVNATTTEKMIEINRAADFLTALLSGVRAA